MDDIFTLPIQEPEPDDDEPRLRIAIRLPSGSRIDRYFSPANKLQAILDFASMAMEENLVGYNLKSPQTLYTELDITIEESGLCDRTLLYLVPPS